MSRVPFDPATDYYQLLGVGPAASTEEIQTAYRRLAKAYHPDLNAGSSVAAARMARVNVAKSVLLDSTTRATYDRARAARTHVAAASAQVAYATRPAYVTYATVGRPRYRVVRATHTGAVQRGSLDRQTGILLLIVLPLLGALLVYVFQAFELSSQPQRALPSDLVMIPSGRPTAHNTAESAFSMLHAQPPSRELATSVNNLIGSSYDGTSTSQQLVADGRRLVRSAQAGDEQAWDAAVTDVCRLAGHC
jgi:curved DNA-binding protein CbpA